MVELSIEMRPSSRSGLYAYNLANLFVQVKVGRGFKLKDDYSFMVYSEKLMLMAGARTGSRGLWGRATRQGRSFSMTMVGKTVWMPGKYFFLMAVEGGSVTRIDLDLDENRCFVMGKPHRCKSGSDEDVLARQVFDHHEYWRDMFLMLGSAQLRHKALEWLKRNVVGLNHDDHQQGRRDSFDYNLLITTDQSLRTVEQGVKPMLKMCAIHDGAKVRFGDCKEFFDQSSKNPYHALDALFDELVDLRGNKDFDAHESQKYIFVIYNLIYLRSGDVRERLVRRLHEVGLDERSSVIFCGLRPDIEALMEQDPSLKNHFTDKNCLYRAPYTVEEVVSSFFLDNRLDDYVFSPAAVEKVCRLFIEAARRGKLLWPDTYVLSLKLHLLCREFTSDAPLLGNEIRPEDIEEKDFLCHLEPTN